MYEAAAEFSEIGAGVIFWERTWKVFTTLGLAEDLAKVSGAPINEKRSELSQRRLIAFPILITLMEALVLTIVGLTLLEKAFALLLSSHHVRFSSPPCDLFRSFSFAIQMVASVSTELTSSTFLLTIYLKASRILGSD